MHIWEEQLIFLKYLEKICGIYWGIIDYRENILEKFDDTKQLEFESLWIETINNDAKLDIPILFGFGENIYVWIFSLEEKYYVFGPVCTNLRIQAILTPVQSQAPSNI